MIRLPNSISYIFFLKKLDRFCILCVGWAGRKYREISQKISKNTDKYRNIGDIFEKLRNFFEIAEIFLTFQFLGIII